MLARMDRTFALGAGFLLLLGTAQAHADTSLAGTASMGAGYTNNIRGVPENSEAPNAETPEADGFMNLTPGIVAGYETRRGIHTLGYIFNAQLSLNNSETNSFAHTVGYDALLSTSANSSIRFGTALNSGRLNGFNQVAGVEGGELVPEDDITFINYSGNSTFRNQFDRQWTGELSFAANAFRPTSGDSQGATLNLEPRVAVERGFQSHLVAGSLRAAYNVVEVIGAEEDQKILSIRPEVRWVWNISETLSSASTVGLDIIGQAPSLERGITTPRANAAVTYQHERGTATVNCGRAMESNFLTGDITQTDGCGVILQLPVPYISRLQAIGGASYNQGKFFNAATGELRGDNSRLNMDVSFAYLVTPAWNVSFRFETSVQDRDEDGMGATTTNQTIGTLVIAGRIPETITPRVPRQNNSRVESGNAAFDEKPAGEQKQP